VSASVLAPALARASAQASAQASAIGILHFSARDAYEWWHTAGDGSGVGSGVGDGVGDGVGGGVGCGVGTGVGHTPPSITGDTLTLHASTAE
jgi:hypothetical protein